MPLIVVENSEELILLLMVEDSILLNGTIICGELLSELSRTTTALVCCIWYHSLTLTLMYTSILHMLCYKDVLNAQCVCMELCYFAETH